MYKRIMTALFIVTVIVMGRSNRPAKVAADELPEEVLREAFSPSIFKDIAKAKREALRTDLKDLARAKLEAARMVYEGRLTEYMTGRGTIDFLQEASLLVLQSELALAETEDDRILCLERSWLQAKLAEDVNESRFKARRISRQDYAKAQYDRLEAQRRWVEAVKKNEKK